MPLNNGGHLTAKIIKTFKFPLMLAFLLGSEFAGAAPPLKKQTLAKPHQQPISLAAPMIFEPEKPKAAPWIKMDQSALAQRFDTFVLFKHKMPDGPSTQKSGPLGPQPLKELRILK